LRVRRKALLPADRQRLEPSCIGVSAGGRGASKCHLDIAGDRGRDGRCDPSIGDLHDLSAGFGTQHLEQQMRLAAVAV
jgi:hypothetical protein